jgi:hypothetical protein
MSVTVASVIPATYWDDVIRRGAALLDERGPIDWRTRIDLDRLNVQSVYYCVVGQVFTTRFGMFDAWDNGLVQLGAPDDDDDDRLEWLVARGFDAPNSYLALSAAWHRYLTIDITNDTTREET